MEQSPIFFIRNDKKTSTRCYWLLPHTIEPFKVTNMKGLVIPTAENIIPDIISMERAKLVQTEVERKDKDKTDFIVIPTNCSTQYEFKVGKTFGMHS